MSLASGSKKTKIAAAAALLAAGLAGAGYFAGTSGVLTADTRPPAISPADPSVAHANALSAAFRASADRVLPAVVSIQNESKPRMVKREATPRGGQPGPRGAQPFGGRQLPKEFGELDPFLKKFFEQGPGFGGPDGFEGFELMPDMPRQSAGSGVIIDLCKDDGIWFDAEELARILVWIRSGGVEKADPDEEARKAALRARFDQIQPKSFFARILEAMVGSRDDPW